MTVQGMQFFDRPATPVQPTRSWTNSLPLSLYKAFQDYKFTQGPTAGQTSSSAGVFNSQNQLIRTIWTMQINDPRVNQPVFFWWDGTLDDGTIAPLGTYTIGLLTNTCTYTWDGVVGNTCPDHYRPANYYPRLTYIGGTTPIWGMAIANSNDVYFTNNYHEKRFTTFFTKTSDMQHAIPPYLQFSPYPSNNLTTGDWAAINFTGAICTDGTNIYFNVQSGGANAMPVKGVVASTHLQIMYSAGDANGNIGYYTVNDGNGFVTGLAAQYGGTGYLYIFHPGATSQTIIVCNEVTGATVLTLTSPAGAFCGACNPVTTNEIWINYGSTALFGNTTTEKFTINPGTGAITTTGIQIIGPSARGGMAISPDGTTLLLIDNLTNQVRAYNTSDGSVKVAWATSGVLGQLNGYANGPAVTNDKFMFFGPYTGLGSNLGGYICYAPDGSFWVGDTGNQRSLHFSAGNSPTVIETVAYQPTIYSVQVCRGDPTRVFAYYLEWQIDYSKPLQPDNGSWTLKNNWGYFMLVPPGSSDYTFFTALGDAFGFFAYVGVYSNGRTYAKVRNQNTDLDDIFELDPTTGARYTGKGIHQRNRIDHGTMDVYSIDGSWGAPGGGALYRDPFTGFDGSNNPTWAGDPTQTGAFFPPPASGWVTVLHSQATPPQFPDFETFEVPIRPLANGIYLSQKNRSNPGTGSTVPWTNTNHIGGFDSTTGAWRFSIHPESQTLFGGQGGQLMFYPDAPYTITGGNQAPTSNFQGSFFYTPGKTDFFSCVRGEVWQGGQTNIWTHWHQSGLVIGRFGEANPFNASSPSQGPELGGSPMGSLRGPQATIAAGVSDYWWGMPGHAGNVSSGGVAYVDSDNAYIYHGEEWVHSGVHRWHIANYSSVNFTTAGTINWDPSSYVPPVSGGSDMLAGLPFYVTNLANGAGGWTRNPTSNIGTWPGTTDPLNGTGSLGWIVATNMIVVDKHLAPDLYWRSVMDGGTGQPRQNVSISKAIPRTNTNNWTMTIEFPMRIFLGGNEWDAHNNLYNAVWFDIVDGSNKRIVSVFPGFYTNSTRGFSGAFSAWVNEQFTTNPNLWPPGISGGDANSVGFAAYQQGGTSFNNPTPRFDCSQFHTLPPLILSADVNAGTITATYGPAQTIPTVVTVYDVGADIVHPTQFQINQKINDSSSVMNVIFSITKLTFSDAPPGPPPGGDGALYRLIQPHYLNDEWRQVGEVIRESDITGNYDVPRNWKPTLAVDPLNTRAINAFYAAGPRAAGSYEDLAQWANSAWANAIPSTTVRPVTYWVKHGSTFSLTGLGANLPPVSN